MIIVNTPHDFCKVLWNYIPKHHTQRNVVTVKSNVAYNEENEIIAIFITNKN